MRLKGQVWSMDAILAVVLVVMAVIGLIVFSSSQVSTRRTATLVEESAVLSDTLGAPGDIGVIADTLDEQRVAQLARMDYLQIKQELGLASDFCIHFTDTAGNLKDVGGVRFLGSPSINVSVGGLRYTCNGTLLTPTVCNNGLDDDSDTLTDMADPGCRAPDDMTE